MRSWVWWNGGGVRGERNEHVESSKEALDMWEGGWKEMGEGWDMKEEIEGKWKRREVGGQKRRRDSISDEDTKRKERARDRV
jgi:hypothetical protein